MVPSLKAEEVLLKVYAEIAKLSKKIEDDHKEADINQRFIMGAGALIFLSQLASFFM